MSHAPLWRASSSTPPYAVCRKACVARQSGGVQCSLWVEAGSLSPPLSLMALAHLIHMAALAVSCPESAFIGILSNFPYFTWTRSEKNVGNHSEKNLCAPNVQNMASDPDFKCGGGKSGAGETAVSQKSHNLLISASLQIFSFYQVLRMFCEHCGKRGNCEIPK